MAEDAQCGYREEPSPGLSDQLDVACDEDGQPLDPPYFLVSDIARRKLLPATLSGRGAVSERRIQEMIEDETLPARKATFEEMIILLKNGRVRRVTDKGVWLVSPGALLHAERHRKRVGFPKNQTRPKRGKKTGVGEAQR